MKSFLAIACLGVAAATNPDILEVCKHAKAMVNVTGTDASTNFYKGCQRELLLKDDSLITSPKQCTSGRNILAAFETTKCDGDSANGADDDDHCSCSVMSAASCAVTVAECATACADPLDPECIKCVIGLGGDCCQCAGDAFGFDCSADCS